MHSSNCALWKVQRQIGPYNPLPQHPHRPNRGHRSAIVCASAEEVPELKAKPTLNPPPVRPPPELTRVPPSPRTLLAKERYANGGAVDRVNGNGVASLSHNNGFSNVNNNQNGRSAELRRPKPFASPETSRPPRPNHPGPRGPGAPGPRAPGPPAARPVPGTPARDGSAGGRGSRGKDARKGQGKNEKAGVRSKRQDFSDEQVAGGVIATRRNARQARRRDRDEKQRAGRDEKEEIFEVGSEGLSVQELAKKLATSPAEIVKILFFKGVMVQVNQVLDVDAVKLVAGEFGVEVEDRAEAKVEDGAKKTVEFVDDGDIEFLVPRPPVVTVMGHVDHGKTSLLDYIRKTKVAAGEAGGITQAIGAYTCKVDSLEGEKLITFLDTPGHEAFSAMRARGARVTDIAIIICAADDGVQPQTQEAIGHAKAAGVPIIVAINKVDKEGANVEAAKRQLSEAGLLPEEWGGQTPMVAISAKKGLGVDELLENVLLVAEMEELMSNPKRQAAGTVVEAHLDRQRGPVATLLVQAGTLRVGDIVCAGAAFGRVRQLRDTNGDVKEAGPSIAVQMVGLNAVPDAGDLFDVTSDESEARRGAEDALQKLRMARLAEQAGGGSRVTLSSLATIDEEAEALQRLNIILKGDASGSVEAVKAALSALPQDSVMLRFLLTSTGDISSSDVDLAYASGGMVIGFNVQPSETVLAQAKRQGVQIRSYDVIYHLLDDVRAAMEGRLAPVEERLYVGEAKVKAVFPGAKGKVAGCAVTDGALRKDCLAEVVRRKKVVHEGKLFSLRRVKEDVKEVVAGTECGAGVQGVSDWMEGDIIKCYEVVSKHRKLEDASATSILELQSAAA